MRTNWWDTIIWVILFLFLIPSGLAVAAWGSLPGQRLYQIKLLTERAGTVFAFSDEAKSKVQVELTGKRLNEATQLLTDESSAEGLEYFRKQVEEAKEAIARAPAGEARTALTMQYVETLQNASLQLEEQRQVMSSPNYIAPVSRPSARSTGGSNTARSQIPQQIVVVNQITQVTQVVQVIQQITQTQEQINTVINQVQNLSETSEVAPTQTPIPTATPIPTIPPSPTSTPVIQQLMQMQAAVAGDQPTETQSPKNFNPTAAATPIPTTAPIDTPADNGNHSGNSTTDGGSN